MIQCVDFFLKSEQNKLPNWQEFRKQNFTNYQIYPTMQYLSLLKLLKENKKKDFP